MPMHPTTLWSSPEWARSASADNYSYNPVGGLSRAKNVDALINSVRNGKRLLPFVRRVDVHHGSPSDVICFDFASQLLSLLQNPSIMTAENLAIDINDPLKPYHKLKGSNVLGEPLHLVWSAAIICTVFPLLLVTEGKVQEPDNTDIVWNFSRAGGMKTAIAKKTCPEA
ncbi:hypothetical protein MHU86_24911 [Fragilaria crotonensis]|nr:hypothetical protein MHU86_24911 [Fragilaria crotonensis]